MGHQKGAIRVNPKPYKNSADPSPKNALLDLCKVAWQAFFNESFRAQAAFLNRCLGFRVFRTQAAFVNWGGRISGGKFGFRSSGRWPMLSPCSML